MQDMDGARMIIGLRLGLGFGLVRGCTSLMTS